MTSVARTEEKHKEPCTFTDILRIETAAMQAAHPERANALSRAHAAIIEGHVRDLGAGVGQVRSDTGEVWHTVNGVCDCTAAGFGKPCKHLSTWKFYQHIQAKWQAQTAQAAPSTPPGVEKTSVPSHFIQEVQGTKCIKYVGLLALAHAAGLQGLDAQWTHNETELSLAMAVARFADGRRFVESGDSTPSNARRVKEHWRRLALTRAKARVLRDALAIDMCSVEEME